MKVFRYLRNLVVFVLVMILAVFIYDGYHRVQGTDRESNAHTTVEKRIEQGEDTLSRTDRIIRLFTFKEKVEAALNQRVPKEHWVKGDVIPEYTKNALIAIEDKRYYKHGAIDVLGIIRAFYTNTIAGETVEGGSTITQQLAKNLYFSQEKTMNRKAAEVFLALELERNYTKDEILELYVNSIYFGDGYYNVGEASEGYFGKPAAKMNDYECTLL
uniref:biosynthetic peptidoglycan transglycosylase n=1 Tax=Veillonella dispar TaxID=39778 RepID=UPI0026EB0317